MSSNNAPVEPLQQPVKEEVQRELTNSNNFLSEEEIQKIYDDIINTFSDPEQRKQALEATGLDFSKVDVKNVDNKNDATSAETAIKEDEDPR